MVNWKKESLICFLFYLNKFVRLRFRLLGLMGHIRLQLMYHEEYGIKKINCS